MPTSEKKANDWLDDQVDELNEAFADVVISEPASNTVSPQPEKVDRATADSLNNYAQSLDDPITHVVDYGGLVDGSNKKKKQ
jgi:hypothetical protein